MARHFRSEEWVDFARSVVGADKRKAMQDHLDSGCKACAEVVNLWQRVQEVSQRDAVYAPPSSAVKTVEGMFAIYGGHLSGKAKTTRLIFDNLQVPRPAGVRSAAPSVRQLLYGAGEYRVDIRIEPQMDSPKAALVGQVLNSQDPNRSIDSALVTLLKGGKVRMECLTNRFGEFRFECDLESGLSLAISLPDGAEVLLPVIDQPLDQVENKGISRILQGAKRRTRKKV
jgi:hypothetical protein